ncbi:MAG: hypothetical protein A4E67_02048 [Syntrophaceae bacterium PtaB.Bin038]|jgi:hypothetical protein|nr:MAG: hypothetical protein A4E67_02048 [Syntrophaceae bacterium PtaB.Bin038]
MKYSSISTFGCRKCGFSNIFTLARPGLTAFSSRTILFSLPTHPAADVVLEKTTLRKQYGGGKVDPIIAKDFNDKNRSGYELESAFPPEAKPALKIRDDRKEGSTLGIGRTHISRAGFNNERTRALLYVAHVESRPRSHVSYFVTLEKKGDEWIIAGTELAGSY